MTDSDGERERGSAAWWDERYAAEELLWSVEPNRFVVAECAALPPGRALDLACGEGRNAVWLAGHGWQVTAVDFSRVALDKARRLARRTHAEVQWVEADVLAWAGERGADWAGPFDLVLVAYLQLVRDDRQHVLSAAAAVTAPGGSVLVVGHDLSNLVEGTGGPQDARLLWTVDEVVRPGFTAARAGVADRPVDDLNARDTVVRLQRDS